MSAEQSFEEAIEVSTLKEIIEGGPAMAAEARSLALELRSGKARVAVNKRPWPDGFKIRFLDELEKASVLIEGIADGLDRIVEAAKAEAGT